MNLLAYLPALRKAMPKFLRRLRFGVLVAVLALEVLAVLLIDREPTVWHGGASPQHYFTATRNILRNTAKSQGQAKFHEASNT